MSDQNTTTDTQNDRTADYFDNAIFDEIIRYEPFIFEDDEIQENQKSYLDEVLKEIKHYISNEKDVGITISPIATDYMNSVHSIFDKDNEEFEVETNKLYSKKIQQFFTNNGVGSNYIFFDLNETKKHIDSAIMNQEVSLSNKVLVTLYLRHNFDLDNDGVKNDVDKCPNTKANVRVDEVGCVFSTLIMLVDNNSTKNAIEVKTQKGSGVIDKPNAYTRLASSNSEVKVGDSLPLDEMNELFGDVLSVDTKTGNIDATIYFNNKIEITKESIKKIKTITESLKNKKVSYIKIIGHTDTRGDSDSNIELAQERANYVAQYVKDTGMSYSKMDVESYGESDLKVKTEDEVELYINRRVEILIR